MLCLYVSVPITSFRAPRAREYLETLPAPPPATLYGLLCSIVGEPDRLVHRGAEVAVAVLSAGARSRVLRVAWQIKKAQTPQGVGENKGPDFQELLLGVRLGVGVRAGNGEHAPFLADRLAAALAAPSSIRRFGGLALGESSALVDEVRALQPPDLGPDARWLVQDGNGPLALPVWVDHVGSRGTRYTQFATVPAVSTTPPENAWVDVGPSPT